ncbi:cytochrome P450 monooxygenase [Fusarium subglutinans]|uniref:Cytochrome P450 monooxygenase n=1 Tax=Gibberella subglutinans TaxID=42677 RepID=A0A8H5UME6_GIBSU|nr:cytochrome P450 monooxygenase [Fusarium subglutinans]KAF5593132.1 cytochrome P450 monooxygenase [Fusarium subglutinans]
MRFRNLFAVCLATDVALASVCKPRPSASSSVMTVESATSTISATAPTTTVQAESTTATSADLSTTLTSTVDDETTAEATETATTIETSVTVGLSTTAIETTGTTETANTETATTDTTTTDGAATDETTTTALATSAETTTADATTTTADNFDPIPTFNVLAIGAQVDGQKLSGEVEPGYDMGWNLPGAPQILAFSIEPDTSQVREIGGNYLCVRYTDRDIHFLTLCDPGTETNFMGGIARVTCEQTRDQRLECSAPAGQCMDDPLTGIPICSAMPGTFTGFYAYSGGPTGVTLAMGREDIASTTDTQSVDLGIEPASDDT